MEISRNRAVKVQRGMASEFFGVLGREDSCWSIVRDQAKDRCLYVWLALLTATVG